MAKLSSAKRKRLPPIAFAWPEREKLPIHDAGHVRSSLGRFAQTSFPDMATARRAASRILRAARKLGIPISPASGVAKVAAQLRRGTGVGGQDTGRPKKRRNPAPTPDRKLLERAREISRDFHGTAGEVLQLSEKERRLPKYVVALGSIPELEYEPQGASKRSKYRWRHESGDRGPLATRSKKKPMLAVDPASGRPMILSMGSPMKLDPKRGLVG